jgi:hypothetical protein
MLFDLIILTNTKNYDYQKLTSRCIQTYIDSGDLYINKIILVETNKNWNSECWKQLSTKIHFVCPLIPFNYNRFLNKALELCTAPLICISNNDVEVHKNCIPNIIEAFDKDSELMSASPIDRSWHRNSYNDFPRDDTMYQGYETTKYVLGFNIYTRSSAYEKIGLYDERFDFYYQDNDYEMCLKTHGLKHCLISTAHINHGKNKPSDEQEFDVHLKLKSDREKFVSKWSNNKLFNPYLKLGILADASFKTLNNKYVQVSPNMQDIQHCHYFWKSNLDITSTLINTILNKIDLTDADQIIIDKQNVVIRNF